MGSSRVHSQTDNGFAILLVDDEQRICDNLKQTVPWDDIGIDRVLTANSAEEAQHIFAMNEVDIVVTDIRMHEMSGLDLIKHIREKNRHIPIVILSAYDLFSYAKEAVSLNVSRYILKPIMLPEMIETLHDVVGEIRTARKQAEFEGKIQKQIQTNLDMLRERFLYEVLTMTTRIDNDFANNLKFYHIDETLMRGGLVMSFQAFPPQNDKVKTEQDWLIFKFAVKNIVQEVIAEYQPAYNLPYVDDRLPVIFAGSDASTLRKAAYEVAHKINSNIYNYLEVEINAGIGRWYGNARDLQTSYSESMDVLKFSEFEGYRRVDHIEDVEKVDPSSWRDISSTQMQSIMQTIMKKDWDNVLLQWNEVEKSFRNPGNNVPFELVKTYCVGLISSIAVHDPEDWTTDQLLDELFLLSKSKNKDGMLSLVQQLLSKQVDRYTNQQRCSPYVSEVRKYVEDHYHEEISFSELARNLHLSRTYLSYLFKRETGDTFVNYLIKYRIDVAKNLMRSSRHLMVREIAEMVGYPDPAYFSRLFKNVTGMSPSEFQMQR